MNEDRLEKWYVYSFEKLETKFGTFRMVLTEANLLGKFRTTMVETEE